MDAWIDCLTYRDEDDGMASVVVPSGDVLTLQLDEGRAFAQRCPEQYAALIECAAFEAQAADRLGERADGVLRGPRATLGPPWTKDHRVALAATVLAATG
jgi:hypothetical protein